MLLMFFSRYAWVVPWKDKKKGITVVNTVQKILNDPKRKPNKIWVDKGSEFHKLPMKSWLEENDIEMEIHKYLMKKNGII